VGLAELSGELTPSELLAQSDLMLMGHKRAKAVGSPGEPRGRFSAER